MTDDLSRDETSLGALILALLLFATPCFAGINVFFHDENKANEVATEFLKGLANHNYERSYALLLPIAQNQIPYQIFLTMAKSQEEKLGKIESMVWDAFYPQPGQPLIGLHYVVRYSVSGEADYYLLLQLENKNYLIQYFVNGPKGKVTPRFVLQMKMPIERREILLNQSAPP